MDQSAFSATATAAHLALTALLRHRSGAGLFSPRVVVSMLASIAPWIWPSTGLVVAALAGHLAWLWLCERLWPRVPRRPAAPVAPPPIAASVANRSPSPQTPAPSPSPMFCTAPVLAVLEETPEIRTFRFARPDNFAFTAGQFVPVRVSIDGKPHVRCYSISSSPDVRGFFEISVRRQGLVSRTLHATLRPGTSATVGRPAGAFVYPENDARPLALIAGGIGITPLLAMCRHAVSADPGRPVTLLYSARREQDLAFLPELRLIAERHPQTRLAITLTQDTGDSRWARGRIDAVLLRRYVHEPALTLFYICGPAAMIAEMRALLRSLEVPEGQIRSEEFDTASAAALVNRAVPAPAAVPSPATTSHARITFAASGRTVDAPLSMTLLDVADTNGLAIPSSCRAGVCQSCRTRVTSGDVDCQSDVIEMTDRAQGFVLPCVTWARGDCTLDA